MFGEPKSYKKLQCFGELQSLLGLLHIVILNGVTASWQAMYRGIVPAARYVFY
jgi:hypothetical protein